MHQARVHYDKVASYMRATGITDVRMNKDALITPHEMPPITEDDLLRAVSPAWNISTSRPSAALEDTNAAVEMAPWQVQGNPPSKGPKARQWTSPAGNVNGTAFDELLALSTKIPEGVHCCWLAAPDVIKGLKREDVRTEDLLAF
ncbi:hypothetical protein V8C26DRAFT_394457 [Trichoderma gracile]